MKGKSVIKGAEVQHNRQTTLMFRPKRSILEMVSVREDSLAITVGTNDGLGMAREAARDLKTVESVATEEEMMMKNSRSNFQRSEDAEEREERRKEARRSESIHLRINVLRKACC